MVSEPLMANSTDSSILSSLTSPINKDPLVWLTMPITTKLTRTNYLSWQSQIIPILHGYDLFGFVNPQISPPTPTLTGDNGQLELNPAYLAWRKQDQVLLGWLRASLTESVLSQVVSCTSSSQLWSSLQRSFSATSRARLTELRRKLQTTVKGSTNCTDFLLKLQAISDELAFIGYPVHDEDMVTHVLNGLGPEFNAFVVAITSRVEPINIHGLHSLLLTHEQLLQNQHISSVQTANSTAYYAHVPKPKIISKTIIPMVAIAISLPNLTLLNLPILPAHQILVLVFFPYQRINLPIPLPEI